MFSILKSSPFITKSSNYAAILELLDEVEFANIQSEIDGVIGVRMLTEYQTLEFDIVEGSAKTNLDRTSIRMITGEHHYGLKLLQRTVAIFAQKGTQLTVNNKVEIFLNLYDGLKGDDPAMDEHYRSIFPGLSFWMGIQLGMVQLDPDSDDIWRFV